LISAPFIGICDEFRLRQLQFYFRDQCVPIGPELNVLAVDKLSTELLTVQRSDHFQGHLMSCRFSNVAETDGRVSRSSYLCHHRFDGFLRNGIMCLVQLCDQLLDRRITNTGSRQSADRRHRTDQDASRSRSGVKVRMGHGSQPSFQDRRWCFRA
jgi:hypothetical protein